MQPGGRSGYGSALLSVDRLIPFAIGGRIFAGDVRGQRDVTDLFDSREEIVHGREADVPLAKAAAPDHLRLEFIVFSKEQMFSQPNLPSGSHQAFPFVGVVLNLPRE